MFRDTASASGTLLRIGGTSRRAVLLDRPQILSRQLMIRIQLQRTLEMLPRLGNVSRFRQRAAQIGFRIRIIWTQLGSRSKLFQRTRKVSARRERVSQVVVRIKIIRPRRERSLQQGNCLRGAPRSQQRRAKSIVCRRIVRMQLHRV